MLNFSLSSIFFPFHPCNGRDSSFTPAFSPPKVTITTVAQRLGGREDCWITGLSNSLCRDAHTNSGKATHSLLPVLPYLPSQPPTLYHSLLHISCLFLYSSCTPIFSLHSFPPTLFPSLSPHLTPCHTFLHSYTLSIYSSLLLFHFFTSFSLRSPSPLSFMSEYTNKGVQISVYFVSLNVCLLLLMVYAVLLQLYPRLACCCCYFSHLLVPLALCKLRRRSFWFISALGVTAALFFC